MSKNKKILFQVGIAVVVLIMAVLLFMKLSKKVYALELLGESEITLEYGQTFEDPGFKVFLNDKELEDETLVSILEGDFDETKIGTYIFKYQLNSNDSVFLEREVTIVDTENPTITLKASEDKLYVGDTYKEVGFSATDNYDGDISEDVKVTGAVDTSKAGTYKLTYTVADSSGNTFEVIREVTVEEQPVIEEPKTNDSPNNSGNNSNSNSANKSGSNNSASNVVAGAGPSNGGPGVSQNSNPPAQRISPIKTVNNSSNEIIRFNFTKQGIYLEGVQDAGVNVVGLLSSSGSLVKEFSAQQAGTHYNFNLALQDVANGTYTLVSKDGNLPLLNKMAADRKIKQAKIGNKLVTINYPNNKVEITIANHVYKYDIAINAGHGGTDGGAYANGIKESEINLKISLYEKAAFERHGLKVYINRTSNDTYGEESGPSDWPRLRRSAYKIGEIATVSRYAYSNHHNSGSTKSSWEILVNARATAQDLAIEHRVGDAWTSIYGKAMPGLTIYTKNYDTNAIVNKKNGPGHGFLDWYGMQRVPDMLYQEFIPTYEHIYLSNAADVSWYTANGDAIMKQMAEAKVKEYVTAMGKTYIAP